MRMAHIHRDVEARMLDRFRRRRQLQSSFVVVGGVRSIEIDPEAGVLEKMELRLMRFWMPESTRMPARPLKAMVLSAPAIVQPMMLPLAFFVNQYAVGGVAQGIGVNEVVQNLIGQNGVFRIVSGVIRECVYYGATA
jgi:hypothetical protein